MTVGEMALWYERNMPERLEVRRLPILVAEAAVVLGITMPVRVQWTRFEGGKTLAEWIRRDGINYIGVCEDLQKVPRYVLRYLVYHELLHSILQPRIGEKSSRILRHHYAFRVAERLIPGYLRAISWLKRKGYA